MTCSVKIIPMTTRKLSKYQNILMSFQCLHSKTSQNLTYCMQFVRDISLLIDILMPLHSIIPNNTSLHNCYSVHDVIGVTRLIEDYVLVCTSMY